MRTCAVLIILSAGLCLAGTPYLSPAPETTGEVLWENPYSYDELDSHWESFGMWHCMDNFTLDEVNSIGAFVFWAIYEEDPDTYELEVVIYESRGGYPGAAIGERVLVDTDNITQIDTGDDSWGYDLYETHIDLNPEDVYKEVEPGIYWLEVYSPNCQAMHWICGYPGDMVHAHYFNGELDQHAADGFFVVEDASTMPIEDDSWGAIKADAR